MELLIHSEPELDNDITLLIKIYIDKYNYTLGYWTNKEIDVRAYDYLGTGEVFTAYVEELILDRLTGNMSITILNISVESYNSSNVYYIFFEETTFNFPGINVPESTLITYSTNIDYIDNIDSNIISNGSTSSSGLSGGAIAGLIIAIVVASAGIISPILYCCCRKPKPEIKPKTEVNESENLSISTTTSKTNSITNQNKIEKNDRTLTFQTTAQLKKSIVIDGDKNVRQMRKIYFRAINRKDLIKDSSIYFLYKGKIITENKNDLVKNLFQKDNEQNIIAVIDQDDKIQEEALKNQFQMFDK